MKNKIIDIKWEDFYRDCASLSVLVESANMHNSTMIVVANGGLFVGGMLGRFLKNDKINTVGSKRRKCNDETKVDITYFDTEIIKKKLESGNKKILIVDDIYDSGSTIAAVHEYIVKNCFGGLISNMLTKIMYATPYYKAPFDNNIKDFDINPLLISPMKIDISYWIKYPWEIGEE
jgi:hypoxanthine phosphoribosyltransferase